ncbi:monovalent cation/H+ antiporter complex subunit F [Streptomyces sp. NPDC053499]|uniref:monovalent cation/H+ antiporter complex subunit F n=1 Tax=Streptomyces sp. NPDC053499 TaxID=3365707 RepID=UPI0037D56C97
MTAASHASAFEAAAVRTPDFEVAAGTAPDFDVAAVQGPAFEVAAAVIAGLLLAAGLMVTLRLVRGPSTLDRAVALDALVAVVMAGIGLQSAVRSNPFYLPVLLVLSFLGFTGSVGVARFMALRDEAGTENVDESEGTGEPGTRPEEPR